MKIFLVLLLVMTGLLISSCSKQVDSVRSSSIDTVAISVSNFDIYAVGDLVNYDQNSVLETNAVYWKNGVLNILCDTASVGSYMAINGKDVYVVGELGRGTLGAKVGYWKNGQFTSLSHGYYAEYASGIYVNGTDVYVIGAGLNASDQEVAEYWNNGVQVTLDSVDAATTGIAASGNDIYIAGWSSPNGKKSSATLWKNGIPTYLTDGNHYAAATSVFISGTDVYVTGYESDHSDSFIVAKYWKNGVPTTLADSTSCSTAHSIYVSGTDIYVSGFQHAGSLLNPIGNQIGLYWKNGVENIAFDGSSRTDIFSILVWNSDLYSSYTNAAVVDTKAGASYLKNGVPQTLDVAQSLYGSVTSIYLSKTN